MPVVQIMPTHRIRSHEGIPGDGLPKHLHAQHIRDNLLSLAIQISVHKCNMVVGHHAVPQGRQPLFDALHDNVVRQ